MRKLILAIIVVICVDIGFVVYKSGDDQVDIRSKDVNVVGDGVDLAANAPNDLTELPQTADDPTIADLNAEPTRVIAERLNPAPARHRTNRTSRSLIERRSYAAKMRLRGIKRDRVLPTPVDLQNITIYYAVRKPSETGVDKEFAGERSADRQTDLSGQPMRTQLRSENRSLIARMLPIVKKPYDWIKSVGSRLF